MYTELCYLFFFYYNKEKKKKDKSNLLSEQTVVKQKLLCGWVYYNILDPWTQFHYLTKSLQDLRNSFPKNKFQTKIKNILQKFKF